MWTGDRLPAGGHTKMRLPILTTAFFAHVLALMCIVPTSAGAAARVSSGDGVSLSLSSRGEVDGFALDGKAIRLRSAGGFFLADYNHQPKVHAGYQPVTGRTTVTGEGV